MNEAEKKILEHRLLLKLLNQYWVAESFEAYNYFGKSSFFKHLFSIHSTQLMNKAKPDQAG